MIETSIIEQITQKINLNSHKNKIQGGKVQNNLCYVVRNTWHKN